MLYFLWIPMGVLQLCFSRTLHTSLDGENDISHYSTLLYSIIKPRLCYCFKNATSSDENLHIVPLILCLRICSLFLHLSR